MKAVIYARYSSHSQTEQSIDGQIRVNAEFAKREGFEIVGHYIDRAISGTSAESRPEFQRMIKDARKMDFEAVIVYKLDRFARNRYDSAVYKHKLKNCGVRVISATENISDSPEGIILEAVLEASAEYYSKELSQKVKRGLRESALKGTFTGGHVPIGYKVECKHVVIDEEKAPYIRQAFEDYANGKSKKEIVDMLNSKGVKNTKGTKFTMNSFNHCLKNRKYIGYVSYGGVEYDRTYPRLIDDEIFERVQNQISKMAHAPGSKKARQSYLINGKAFCGLCGSRLIGDAGTSKTGVKHSYYSCSKRKKERACDKKAEKKDFLEWYVVEQTVEYVLRENIMKLIAKRVVEEYNKEFNNSNIKQLEQRIKKTESDANKIFEKLLATENQKLIKRYEDEISNLDLQKEDLEIDLSKMHSALGVKYTEKDILDWLNQFCKGDLMDISFRQKIIDTFISAVYVYDNKVVVYYNIKDGEQVSYMDHLDALEELDEDVCESSYLNTFAPP